MVPCPAARSGVSVGPSRRAPFLTWGQVCRLIQGTLTVINGATSNTPQTKSRPEPGQSARCSSSIPKTEGSLLHVSFSFSIIYMFYI